MLDQVIEVGEDGRFRTNSPLVVGDVNYKFSYRDGKSFRPVPSEFVSYDFQAGGITARADDYSQSLKPISWFFFVGPAKYREAHPNSSFTSDALPVPGRLKPE